jgi:hypothetical protein
MSICSSRCLRLGFAALYALTALIAVALTDAHHSHGDRAAAATAVSFVSKICGGNHANSSETEADCCDLCIAATTAVLEPPPTATFLIRREIATRLHFAQQLGRVADAAPDDLRSRAPPAPCLT